MIIKHLCWLVLPILFAKPGISSGSNGFIGNTSPFERGATSGTLSMKCGRNLVQLGDHKNKVYALCGEPASIDTRTKIVGDILHHPRRTLDIHQYEEVQVEEWVYNFGRRRFQQYLRFENGRLVEIRDLEKGY